VSSGGRLPSGNEIGEGGYHGETYGAEHADLAYKGLGGTVPPHSRAVSTAPSACYALRALLTGVVTIFLSFKKDQITQRTWKRLRGSATGRHLDPGGLEGEDCTSSPPPLENAPGDPDPSPISCNHIQT
jgi:hypothetical protein